MFIGRDVVRRLLQPCRGPGSSQHDDRCPQRGSTSDSRIDPASVSSGRVTGAGQDKPLLIDPRITSGRPGGS